MGVGPTGPSLVKFSVYIMRHVDGHVIDTHRLFGTRTEVDNHRIIEEALPGKLREFDVTWDDRE